MTDPDAGGTGYVFDRSQGGEEARLEEQSRLIDPITERLFREAGVTEGMHVLELGSGAGDVSMLLARTVGPGGAVVGIDGSQEAIDVSQRRIADAGHPNVTFVRADLREFAATPALQGLRFDAVAGRFVLQFLPDPDRTLREAAAFLHPGGLVCFQECDVRQDWAYPATPLWSRVRAWFHTAMDGAGVETRMGLRLYSTFLQAGLPAPTLRMEAAIGGGEQAPLVGWAGVVRAVLHPGKARDHDQRRS